MYLYIFYLWTCIYELWSPTVHSLQEIGFEKNQYTIYKEAHCWASLLTGYLAILFDNRSKKAVQIFRDYFTVKKWICVYFNFDLLKLVTVKSWKCNKLRKRQRDAARKLSVKLTWTFS